MRKSCENVCGTCTVRKDAEDTHASNESRARLSAHLKRPAVEIKLKCTGSRRAAKAKRIDRGGPACWLLVLENSSSILRAHTHRQTDAVCNTQCTVRVRVCARDKLQTNDVPRFARSRTKLRLSSVSIRRRCSLPVRSTCSHYSAGTPLRSAVPGHTRRHDFTH